MVVIRSDGDASTDWSLVVGDGGEDLEACRHVPYDGVLRFSTERRGYLSCRKNSHFNLDAEQVVDNYLAKADVDLPRGLLLARARQELATDGSTEVGADV
jgi:hypothetical protein